MFSASLLHLLHLCDPALPVGGFSHSGGLETYTQAGVVHNKETAGLFTRQQLSTNIFYNDAALASLAYDAASTNDIDELIRLEQLCTAIKLPLEMRNASLKLGTRLLKIFSYRQDSALLHQYGHLVKTQVGVGHYCIAFGVIAHTLLIQKADALTGFYYNTAAGFITNAVKLVPLGQQDGQNLLMELFPLIKELVAKTMSPDEDKIGLCCAAFDIRSMQHEHLYSRLYMS